MEIDFTEMSDEDLELFFDVPEAREELARRGKQPAKSASGGADSVGDFFTPVQSQEPESTGLEAQMEDYLAGKYQTMTGRALQIAMREEDSFAAVTYARRMIEGGSAQEKTMGMNMFARACDALGEKSGLTGQNSFNALIANLWVELGRQYEQGVSDVTNDSMESCRKKAFACYRKASEKDKANVADLIRCYMDGIGTPRDHARASDALEKAAIYGNYEMRMYAGYVMATAQQTMRAQNAFESAEEIGDEAQRTVARCWRLCVGKQNPEIADTRVVYNRAVKAADPWAVLLLCNTDSLSDVEKEKLLSAVPAGNGQAGACCAEVLQAVRKRIADAKAEALRIQKEKERKEEQERRAKLEAQRRKEEQERLQRTAEYRLRQAYEAWQKGNREDADRFAESTVSADDIAQRPDAGLTARWLQMKLRDMDTAAVRRRMNALPQKTAWVYLALAQEEEQRKERMEYADAGRQDASHSYPAQLCGTMFRADQQQLNEEVQREARLRAQAEAEQKAEMLKQKASMRWFALWTGLIGLVVFTLFSGQTFLLNLATLSLAGRIITKKENRKPWIPMLIVAAVGVLLTRLFVL